MELNAKTYKISNFKRYFVWTGAIIIPLIACYMYYAHFNTEPNTWAIQCGFYKITGLLCPGCGGQRSINYLLNGNILQALQSNAIYVLGAPFFAYLYYVIVEVYLLKSTKYTNSFLFSTKLAVVFLAITISFFILRNIPIKPFTYLLP